MLSRLRRLFIRQQAEFDPAWEEVLARDFEQWTWLRDDEQQRLRLLLANFVEHWRWEPARGFVLTEQMKVLIAGQAALLLLGLELDDYPELTSVIVHRSTVRLTGPHPTGGGTYSTSPQFLAGQAHSKGPVVLSWGASRQGAKSPHRGENVVYHEFAHRLDMLDGITDGTPPLGSEAARKSWVKVCTTAYDEVRAEGSPVLRPYAGTNPAEFFAVATEVFFTRSVELRDHEPDLYEELRSFYHQDPAERHHRDGH